MALADIQKRNAEERRREKRLVHVAKTLCRDFLDSAAVKAKAKAYKETAEYVTRSLLEHLFFGERKELRELSEDHIRQFLTGYAPRRMQISAEAGADVPQIMDDLINFLDAAGHIRNGSQLTDAVKSHKRDFLKLLPGPDKKAKPKKTAEPQKAAKAKSQKQPKVEARVGRNDPCPCGSGKKYKKCCGQSQ